MFRWWIVLAVLLTTTTSCRRGARVEAPDPEIGELWDWDGHWEAQAECVVSSHSIQQVKESNACAPYAREVRAFGPTPREAPPVAQCPVRVRPSGSGEGIVADTLSFANAFDAVPWDECVPAEYAVGARRVLRVDDGFIVAYAGMTTGALMWTSDDGKERRPLSAARVVGFSRAPSGTILALAIGRARLGRGGVLALEQKSDARGGYAPRLVATLPLEPSPVAFDDGGTLVGFAQGFVFRVDESGKVENVHYIARSLGRVASIAKTRDGAYYLGVECGILRLVPEGKSFREEFWSARNGASGHWPECF